MIGNRLLTTKKSPTIKEIRDLFSNGDLGGYWEPSPETLYQESNGTGDAAVNAVVGYIANQISEQPAAIQATTANKPYLRKTPQTNRYWLDGNTATANLTATFSSSLGSTCTIAKLDPELGVVWSENQTIGTTYNLITPYAYHGPTLVINRALSAAEKMIVERVMMRKMPALAPDYMLTPNYPITDISRFGTSTRQTAEAVNGMLQFSVTDISINFSLSSVPVPASSAGRLFSVTLDAFDVNSSYALYREASAMTPTVTTVGATRRVASPGAASLRIYLSPNTSTSKKLRFSQFSIREIL